MIHSHHFSAILKASPTIYHWTEQDFLQTLKTLVCQVGLTAVSEAAFTFHPQQGISVVLLLAESHVALHFWPEVGKVTIDLHVCDYQHSNYEKAKLLGNLMAKNLSDENKASQDQWHYLSVVG